MKLLLALKWVCLLLVTLILCGVVAFAAMGFMVLEYGRRLKRAMHDPSINLK